MFATIAVLVCSQAPPLPAITFADQPKIPYFRLRDVARVKGWKVSFDSVTGLTEIDNMPVPVDQPKLFDGSLVWTTLDVKASIGAKRVLIDLSKQEIIAKQGSITVIHTKISSGRQFKDTPPGQYLAGKKALMHVSSIYGSKMPFSIHLKGNYFIHGSEQTQSGPGSHGCIRLPMFNHAAEWFFRWIEPGTPVKVQGRRPTTHTMANP